MSVFDRFLLLFTSPSQAFEGLDETPLPTSQIIISLTIGILVTAIMAFWITNQPEIQREMQVMQADRIQKMVNDGKLTQEQADQQLAAIEGFSDSTFGKVIPVAGGVVAVVFFFFLFSLYLFLMGRFLGNSETFDFYRAMQINAVLTLYSSLTGILTSALIVTLGTTSANLGPVLLLDQFEFNNTLHKLVASADLLNWFYIFLMVTALKVASGMDWLKSSLIIILPYLIWKTVQITLF